MGFFDFGKRRRVKRRSVKKVRKPPAALLRKCRKYGIKTTARKGGKRVYRKASLLKKLLKRKMKKSKKAKKSKKVTRKRRCSSFGLKGRRSGFGEALQGYSFENPGNYGYNQTVKQYPQSLSQTNSYVDSKMNISRPDGLQLGSSDLPIYGVYRDFFGQEVPAQVPPNYNFMGQPDGTLFPVGAPFNTYKTPVSSFGRRRRRRFGEGLMSQISNQEAASRRFKERKARNRAAAVVSFGRRRSVR